MSFEEKKSNTNLKGKVLNSHLSSRFKIYRMFTTIWFKMILDSNLVSKLEIAFSDQLHLLQENILSHQVDDGPQGDIEDIKIIIKKFMQWMLDISLNENSIHYLRHSHVTLEHTYEIFEDLILNSAWNFIKSLCEKVYNKHMIGELLEIINYYTGIVNEFGPMRFKRKLEKTKTVIVSKFWRFILK